MGLLFLVVSPQMFWSSIQHRFFTIFWIELGVGGDARNVTLNCLATMCRIYTLTLVDINLCQCHRQNNNNNNQQQVFVRKRALPVWFHSR